jgi:hypothetical protein
MEHLYVVLWRSGDTGRWDLQGIGHSPRERDIIIEAAKIKNPEFQYGWVEGPIWRPAMMAEREAQLAAMRPF